MQTNRQQNQGNSQQSLALSRRCAIEFCMKSTIRGLLRPERATPAQRKATRARLPCQRVNRYRIPNNSQTTQRGLRCWTRNGDALESRPAQNAPLPENGFMLTNRFLFRHFTTIVVIASAVGMSLGASRAFADLELPQLSPHAVVTQRVGITDVTVDYSSPAVNNRKIWGGLVPWDKPWRTGANQATKITFSRDVNFGGTPVVAGTYSIVSIPSEKNWVVALNKNLTINVADATYDNKDELVRVKATTSAIAQRERLIFAFGDTTEGSTSLDLEWEKLKVSIAIKIDTAAFVAASIKTNVDGAWRPMATAARYYAETLKDLPTAMKYIDQSLGLASMWFNNWIKADILHRMGKDADALKFAQVAHEMGMKDAAGFFAKDQVEKALVDWKKK